MFGREFFETYVSDHGGEFAERHRVPFPRIDVVLRDGTNFWVNSVVMVADGYAVLRQVKSEQDVVDWAVPYGEVVRVTFNTVSGTSMGFQASRGG